MTHLETIVKAYTDCGINFVIREDEGYSYIFFTGKPGTRSHSEASHKDVGYLIMTERFMEFDKSGVIASY